jgi:hypothetical protein
MNDGQDGASSDDDDDSEDYRQGRSYLQTMEMSTCWSSTFPLTVWSQLSKSASIVRTSFRTMIRRVLAAPLY